MLVCYVLFDCKIFIFIEFGCNLLIKVRIKYNIKWIDWLLGNCYFYKEWFVVYCWYVSFICLGNMMFIVFVDWFDICE